MSSVLTRQEAPTTTRLQDAATHHREVCADPYARAAHINAARDALVSAGMREVEDLQKRLKEAGLQVRAYTGGLTVDIVS